MLTRLIVHPIHFDEKTATVSPLAFVDATTIDLSVFREKLATDEEIQIAIDQIRQTGETKVPAQERLVNLVMQAIAGDIRACRFAEGSQMCRIYDTASPEKPAHASIFTPVYARKGSGQRQVRRELLRLFSMRQILAQNYRSLLYEGRQAQL